VKVKLHPIVIRFKLRQLRPRLVVADSRPGHRLPPEVELFVFVATVSADILALDTNRNVSNRALHLHLDILHEF
jgi:hypothetical protein